MHQMSQLDVYLYDKSRNIGSKYALKEMAKLVCNPNFSIIYNKQKSITI